MADQLVYTAPAHIQPAKPFKQGKQVKVCLNNQVATTAIPKNKENQGYEELCAFMNAHPLNGAYFNTLPQLYPVFINEWWYTCNSNDANNVITGTIDQGNTTIAIDQELIREVLELPTNENFSPPPTKEEARASLSVVGFNTPKGAILYSAFTPRWKFLISGIIRSLGGKSGSTGEMNEFETQILSSFITGAKINYAELYFKELLKLTNESHRIFNVPFIRLLSLCFENRLGVSVYSAFTNSVADIPVPTLTSKVFNHVITPDEVPITPPMQQWINNPYGVEVPASQSGNTDSETHTTDSHESGGQSSSGTLSNSQDMSLEDPSSSSPSFHLSKHITTSNSSPSTQSLAQMEQLSMEQDVAITPSSAVAHSTSSLLEIDVPMTTQTQPEPSIDNLENLITTTVETHTVSIEDEVPLLDSVTQSLPPLPQPTPIYTTTPAVVHVYKRHILHPQAQTVNAPVMSQAEVQVSTHSISSDLPSYNLMRCEDIPTLTHSVDESLSNTMIRMRQDSATQSYDISSLFPEIHEDFNKTPVSHDLAHIHSELSGGIGATHIPSDLSHLQHERCEGQQPLPTINDQQPTQSVSSKTLDDVLIAITGLSDRVQTEMHNNLKDLERMKDLVSNLVHKVDAMEEKVNERLNYMNQTLNQINDDIKKGEMNVNRGDRSIKDKDINNNENINDDVNDNVEGDDSDSDDGGDDGPECSKVKSQSATQSAAQTQKSAQTEGEPTQTEREIVAQTEGEQHVIYAQPLDCILSAESVDNLYRRAAQQIKKREREEAEEESSDQPLRIKRAKKRKTMAKKKVDWDKGGKGKKKLSDLSTEEFMSLDDEEDDRDEDDEIDPDCSSEDEVIRDFDDDDDDATIGMIFNKLKSTKGKSAGSQSGTSQTETQHQDSNQRKDKGVKEEEEEEEAITDDPINDEVVKAAQEAGLTPVEYLERIKQNEAQLKIDLELAKRMNRMMIISCRLRDCYVNRRIEDALIMGCVFIKDAHNRIRIDYRLTTNQRRTIFLDQLYTLGFVEWQYIARFMKNIRNRDLKEEIKSEIILLVETSHDLGLLDDDDYGMFCVSHKVKKNQRPLGLLHRRLPDDVTFIENAYIKLPNHEGFCYKDDKGNNCFQSISSLHNTSYHHLLALLDLCKGEQSQPFRKRVVRCLFLHLGELYKIPELKSRCDKIRKEHRENEKDNLEQVDLIERGRREKLAE